MASPMPMPLAFVVKNGSNNRLIGCTRIPVPESRTEAQSTRSSSAIPRVGQIKAITSPQMFFRAGQGVGCVVRGGVNIHKV